MQPHGRFGFSGARRFWPLGLSAALGFVVLVARLPAARQPRPAAALGGATLRLELFVKDVDKSVAFYTEVLGFERLAGDEDYAPVRRDGVLIGLGPAQGLSAKHFFNPELQTARPGLGAEIVIEVDDVKAAFAAVKATGSERLLTGLLPRPWGATDFRLADPDGYYLRITSR